MITVVVMMKKMRVLMMDSGDGGVDGDGDDGDDIVFCFCCTNPAQFL